MLRGELVGLRARDAADVEVLHRAFHDDASLFSRINEGPWRPIAADAPDGPYSPGRDRGDSAVPFSVVLLDDDSLAGSGLLWGIDPHNRSAHVGVSVLPGLQGRGIGTDIVQVLCHYGFVLRGFRRLQLETLADNHAMIRSAERVGFVREGTRRAAAWVEGRVLDELVFGLLADEWLTARQ